MIQRAGCDTHHGGDVLQLSEHTSFLESIKINFIGLATFCQRQQATLDSAIETQSIEAAEKIPEQRFPFHIVFQHFDTVQCDESGNCLWTLRLFSFLFPGQKEENERAVLQWASNQ